MASSLQERCELLDALGGEAARRAGDGEGGDGGAVGVEDRRGERRQADLELVDRRRVAARADQVCAGDLAAAEGEEALPVRRELEGNAAADPVGHADEVRGVLLGEVLDAVGAGHREIDRLAARVGEPPQAGLRELGERLRRVAARVAEKNGAWAEASARRRGAGRGPGARALRRGARSCSSAGRRGAESSPIDGGCGASTTLTSSCAARSMAWVPDSLCHPPILWNTCSTGCQVVREGVRPARTRPRA